MNPTPKRSTDDQFQSADEKSLDWYAVRYLIDELSEDEARCFERQLSDHQAAQEALARAVELIQVTWLAIEQEQQELEPERRNDEHVLHVGQASRQLPSATSTPGKRIWSGRPALLALASSVIFMFALGWIWHGGGVSSNRDTGEEAVLWAELVADPDFSGADDAGQFLVENEIWGWGELGSDDSSLGDEARYQLDDEVQEEPSVDFEMTDEWIMALISLEASEEEGLQ